MTKEMLSTLAPAQRRAIEIARSVAQEKGIRPYLVGGPVRDLLLGRLAIDIDLTLEEGGSTFARSLAKAVEGRVRSFPQFLTYKVLADGLPEFDIATTRKERYRKPGALPTVMAGKLRDDLVRRDFSINAIALDLADETLHDPTGGVSDLHSRVVRVLHGGSFADDPTRIFRAVRLACRLGFSLDENTARLMHEAIDDGALSTVSRERLWRELFLAIDEPKAPAILTELRRNGALDLLVGAARDHTTSLERRLERSLDEAQRDETIDRHVLLAGLLLAGAEGDPTQLEGAGFSHKRLRSVLQIARDLPAVERDLEQAGSEALRFRIFKAQSKEALAVMAADCSGIAEEIMRFRSFREFSLSVKGNDLQVPPGPHVARALERTREAVWFGQITQQEAPAFATKLALKYLSREELSGPK
jgi:tRNA nucleotidyltransferase (CCA-adding enzyme)